MPMPTPGLAPQQVPSSAPQPQPAAPAPTFGGPRSDDQRQKLAALIIAVKKVIFSPQTSQQILHMIQLSKDVKEGIVQATQMIVGEVGRKFGGIDPKTFMVVAAYASSMLIELCVAAKIIPQDHRIVMMMANAIAQHLKQMGQQGNQPAQAPVNPAAQPQPQQASPATAAPPGMSVPMPGQPSMGA